MSRGFTRPDGFSPGPRIEGGVVLVDGSSSDIVATWVTLVSVKYLDGSGTPARLIRFRELRGRGVGVSLLLGRDFMRSFEIEAQGSSSLSINGRKIYEVPIGNDGVNQVVDKEEQQGLPLVSQVENPSEDSKFEIVRNTVPVPRLDLVSTGTLNGGIPATREGRESISCLKGQGIDLSNAIRAIRIVRGVPCNEDGFSIVEEKELAGLGLIGAQSLRLDDRHTCRAVIRFEIPSGGPQPRVWIYAIPPEVGTAQAGEDYMSNQRNVFRSIAHLYRTQLELEGSDVSEGIQFPVLGAGEAVPKAVTANCVAECLREELERNLTP